MRKILKYIGFTLSSILIFVFGSFALDSVTEQVIVRQKINSFKEKAVYQEDLSTETRKLYKVSVEGAKCGYTLDGSEIVPGNTGDILATPDSHLVNQFVADFVKFNVGGHAAIVTGDYQDRQIECDEDKCYEATGLDPGDNPLRIYERNYWNDLDFFNEVVGLRADLTEEEIDEVMSVGGGLVGDPYNYNFTFDTVKKSYCTDLITKVYSHVGINTNKDGYWTTVWDVLATPDLYISYYHYTKDGVKYIYYIG